MQKVTQYAAPAAGGAGVIVRTTQLSSRMSLQEDAATEAALQGFIYQLATMQGNRLYALGPAITVPPQLEPVVIAGYPGDHPPNTVPIGNGGSSPFPVCPGGPVTHGTAICVVTSATATPVTIDATENS